MRLGSTAAAWAGDLGSAPLDSLRPFVLFHLFAAVSPIESSCLSWFLSPCACAWIVVEPIT
jgi:hypothetical protein